MQLPWWERLPSRVLDEESALQELAAKDELLVSHRWERADGGEPRLFARIKVGSRDVDLEVRFPRHYPEGCPSVRPMPHDTRISTHQFKHTGVLCLELGPDNWHPDHTAADMIRSAWKLVLYERVNAFEPIEIPSRHVPTLAERILASCVLLRSDELDARLGEAKENVELEAFWVRPHYKQVLLTSFPKKETFETPPSMSQRGHRLPGQFVRLEESSPRHVDIADKTPDFDAFVEKFGKVTLRDELSLVLLRWPDGETRGYLRSSESLIKLEDMPLETMDTTRIPNALYDRVSKLKIGVVGLGSLGSKIAVSLARAGVRRFVLVDGDVMQGENVCRHQGGFCDVGVMKAEVTKQHILDVSPTKSEIKTYAIDVGAATNPEYHAKVLEDLASCDLLVDATASPDAFSLLAGLASDHGRPLVWGEVFGGGLGGLVGSADRDHGPCPRCVRAGFVAEASTWPVAPFTRPSVAYGSDEDPALVATDADVSLIAAAVTNRVADLVIREEPLLPSVLVVGLRRGWIFDAPMQTIPVRVRSDDWSCDRCWKSAEEPDGEAAFAAEMLLGSKADAHDPAHA